MINNNQAPDHFNHRRWGDIAGAAAAPHFAGLSKSEEPYVIKLDRRDLISTIPLFLKAGDGIGLPPDLHRHLQQFFRKSASAPHFASLNSALARSGEAIVAENSADEPVLIRSGDGATHINPLAAERVGFLCGVAFSCGLQQQKISLKDFCDPNSPRAMSAARKLIVQFLNGEAPTALTAASRGFLKGFFLSLCIAYDSDVSVEAHLRAPLHAAQLKELVTSYVPPTQETTPREVTLWHDSGIAPPAEIENLQYWSDRKAQQLLAQLRVPAMERRIGRATIDQDAELGRFDKAMAHSRYDLSMAGDARTLLTTLSPLFTVAICMILDTIFIGADAPGTLTWSEYASIGIAAGTSFIVAAVRDFVCSKAVNDRLKETVQMRWYDSHLLAAATRVGAVKDGRINEYFDKGEK